MVSIKANGRQNLKTTFSPLVFFFLGATFMSFLGRLADLYTISGKLHRDNLDPSVIEKMDVAKKSDISFRNLILSEEDGGPPKGKQMKFVTDELAKKTAQTKDLEYKLDEAKAEASTNKEKAQKYDDIFDQLQKSRHKYSLEKQEAESLNVTLTSMNDKMKKVQAILQN
jgi:hypothetical protein